MKDKYIKSGFFGENITDKSALNLTKVVKEVMNDSGYPTNSCCSGKYSLLELNFVDDTAALLFGLKSGNLYHTNGVVKIVL